MRVRHTLAVVALFLTLLIPFTHAEAGRAANPVVDRALLQQLIATRRDLVAYIATNDVQRGQAFTLAALMAADATLSSDAASLQRDIVRLSWHPTHRRAVPHHAAAPTYPLLAIAGPGALWSPGARPVTPQTLAWSLDPPPAARTLRDPIARPLAASLAALTSWADLLPRASNRASATAPALAVHRATPRAIAPDIDPRYLARAHGPTEIDGGDGAQPLAEANPTVAAALATPLPTPSAHPHAAHARKIPQQPSLAVLTARWHSVTAALAQVRALEAWARGTAPTASITPQDLITSPQVLHERLDRWSALPNVDPSGIAAIQPFLSSDVAVPAPASGATVAISSSIAVTSTVATTGTTSTTGALTDTTALSATIAAPGDTPVITSSITDTMPGAPAQAITSAVEITSSAAVTADVVTTGTVTGTATPDLSATPSPTAAALYATPTSTPSQGAASSIAAAITGTTGLSATTALSSALPVTAPAALDLTDEGGTIALTATTALSASAPLTLVVTLPVTAEQQLVSPEFLSKRGALESVLRQGQALYASLKQSQAAVLADYQARLHATAMRNAGIEQAWYRHYEAYQAYLSANATYVKRKAAFDAYAQRLHQAELAHAAWVRRKEAYDRYQQELAAYNRALAARGLTPVPTVSAIATATPAPTGAATPITPTAMATAPVATPVASPVAPTPGVVAGETPLAATPVAETPAPLLTTTAVVATPAPSPSYVDSAETPEPVVPATPVPSPSFFESADTPTATMPATPVPSPALGTAPSARSLSAAAEAATAAGSAGVPGNVGAARGVTDAVTSGVPADAAPLPPRPVPVPPPGPEPRFTERPPAWPGSPPRYVAPAGPEPRGIPLPDPPPSIPPWDNDTPTLPPSLVSYGGIAMGVGAAGRRETTTAALLADGALDGVGSYQDPIKGVITTYWGGSTPFQSFHPGLDIAAPEGTPVHAAARGIVVWAGLAVPGQPHDSYGNCVIIRHNDHFSTLYGHMLLDPPLQVQVGQIVQQGQVIGYEGMTGWATGPHVHFEIRDDNVQVNPLLLIPNPQD